MTTEEKIQELKNRKSEGKVNAVAEIVKVYWNAENISYYAITAFGNILPHRRVNLDVEPRLLGQEFHSFEICGDLRTENVTFRFSNIDGEISDKFDAFGSGARVEILYYYADVDLLINVWWGSLQQPNEPNPKELTVTASNGFTARENILPSSFHPPECRFTFGGEFDNFEDLETNGCKYDRHLGGVIGALDGDDNPYTFCPRRVEADCTLRLPDTVGGRPRYWGGLSFDVNAVRTDNNSGYTATSKGAGSLLKNSIRVIAGTKKVRNAPLYLFRREVNSSNPDRGFIRGVFELGEGQIQRVYNIKAIPSDTYIGQQHIGFQSGFPTQGTVGYAPNMPNYSSIAHVSVGIGWLNPAGLGAENCRIECDVVGYVHVKTYSDIDTYTRIYSENRVWWILELYTNQRFGKRYSHSIFNIADFIDCADWSDNNVTFKLTRADGTIEDYPHKRTTFNAVIDGRNSDLVITDICRSGRISVPFQHDGKYTITPLRKLSDEELADVPTFNDTFGGNIIWENGVSSLRVSEINPKDLINEVVVMIEDAANGHIERPTKADDRNQQYIAGRHLNSNTYHANRTEINGFGITDTKEARKFSYSVLWFGEFDEGGIKNNCRVTFKTDLIEVLSLKKYDVIKIESNALIGKGYYNPIDSSFYQFEYFRVIEIKKDSRNEVAVICQAYNADAYEDFEVDHSLLPDPPPVDPPPPPPDIPDPCSPLVLVSYSDGFMEIEVPPC